MLDYSDEQFLTSQLREGDADAYAFLFDNYFSVLVDYVFRLVHDDALAEDIVQSVFLKIYDHHATMTFADHLKTYLYKSVYHAALNELRHQKIHANYVDQRLSDFYYTEVLQTPEGELCFQGKQVQGFIDEAVASLPDRCREIYLLKFGQGLRNSDVAVQLGISTKTVEVQTTKALAQLRKNLHWLRK